MNAAKSSPPPGRFINVDLDFESTHDLAPLAAELESKTTVLHSGPFGDRFFVTIETLDWEPGNADQRIHNLCQVIEGLSPASRALWYSATRREFDVGYDGSDERHLLARFTLRSDTVGRIARLGATLAVSVYRPEPSETPASTAGAASAL